MHLWAKEPNKYHQCKKLAPKYTWWKEWHDGELSNEQYTEKYYETVLNQLEPQKIFDEYRNHPLYRPDGGRAD